MSKERFPVAIVGGGPVGLFLSRMLKDYGIKHCIIERRLVARSHPQAHYLNVRTMEILRACSWDVYLDSIRASPPSLAWR